MDAFQPGRDFGPRDHLRDAHGGGSEPRRGAPGDTANSSRDCSSIWKKSWTGWAFSTRHINAQAWCKTCGRCSCAWAPRSRKYAPCVALLQRWRMARGEGASRPHRPPFSGQFLGRAMPGNWFKYGIQRGGRMLPASGEQLMTNKSRGSEHLAVAKFKDRGSLEMRTMMRAGKIWLGAAVGADGCGHDSGSCSGTERQVRRHADGIRLVAGAGAVFAAGRQGHHHRQEEEGRPRSFRSTWPRK